ncbi:MAG: MlaE family ABC transporter permease [Burkholderiaceae bacterium]
MTPLSSWYDALGPTGRAPLRWLAGWWRIVHFGALMLVLALSPSTYRRENRLALARQLYLDTAPILLGFTVLCALISLVLTRIVVVTALSYGLSQYALEMVIRVLVLELIPLTAALFVALRCTIPHGAELARMRRRGVLDEMRRSGLDPMRRELLPRVASGVFATAMLAMLSCVVALLLAYLTLYGFTLSGLPAYTRMFGQVFHPAVTLIFVLKTLFFSLAVSAIPMVSGVHDMAGERSRTVAELQGLVRMFAVLLLVEAMSLMGNYY